MMKKKSIGVVLIAVVAAAVVIAADLIHANKKESNPVWNDIRLDKANTNGYGLGDDWDGTCVWLVRQGLYPNGYAYYLNPQKDGINTGIIFSPSVDGEKVDAIYYDIDDNEADYAVFLMDISLDQATYEALKDRIGEANEKREIENGNIFYDWIEGDKILEIETDADGNVQNILLRWPYEE
ncbi:MAG: hypothetical protein E7236_03815 [Lachnospiraceae bacterium]|nr:hypothetical protein [Lachnospiraceae bacterium]